MPSITRPTARSTSTAAERPTPWLNPTRTASRNTDEAADAGRPRAPEAVKAAGQCKWDGITPGRSGRRVTQWSRKSRTAMCRTFAELNYTPLVDNDRVPAMVTLTYPGDWEAVAPDGASVKRHMVLWRKRFHREYGEPAR